MLSKFPKWDELSSNEQIGFAKLIEYVQAVYEGRENTANYPLYSNCNLRLNSEMSQHYKLLNTMLYVPDWYAPIAVKHVEALMSMNRHGWTPIKALWYNLKQWEDGKLFNDNEIWYQILMQLPHVSVDDLEKVAYWQSPDKCLKGIETRTTIGRYGSRQLGFEHEGGFLDGLVAHHRTLQGAKAVEFVENSDLDGWCEVYRSPNIKSCMNNPEYGVTEYDTYRCYATSAFGLENNGLRLAYVPDPIEGRAGARARAIVHEPTKSFVSVYGSGDLGQKLKDLGYTCVDGYPEGLILWTDEYASGFITPYIDGDLDRGYLHEGFTTWFKLDSDGDYELACASGIVNVRQKCPCCGDRVNEFYGRVLFEDDCGDLVEEETCYGCYHDSGSGYYKGRWANVHDDVGTITIRGKFYVDTPENLDYYNIVFSDYLEVYLQNGVFSKYYDSYIENDARYLEYCDDYFYISDCQTLWNDELVIEEHAERIEIQDSVYWIPVAGVDTQLDEWRAEFFEEFSKAQD